MDTEHVFDSGQSILNGNDLLVFMIDASFFDLCILFTIKEIKVYLLQEKISCSYGFWFYYLPKENEKALLMHLGFLARTCVKT